MTTVARNGGWIQTFSGKQFWPLDPRPEDLDIIDIAHHLSLITRYGGSCRKFYSVGQHSVLVSHACKPEDALWGLMHDAGEAYGLGDLPRPIKHSPGFEVFRRAEHRIMSVVTSHYGLGEFEPESVKWADAALLATEKRDLLARPQADMGEVEWLHGAQEAEALSQRIIPWTCEQAESEFLGRWYELRHEDGGW